MQHSPPNMLRSPLQAAAYAYANASLPESGAHMPRTYTTYRTRAPHRLPTLRKLSQYLASSSIRCSRSVFLRGVSLPTPRHVHLRQLRLGRPPTRRLDGTSNSALLSWHQSTARHHESAVLTRLPDSVAATTRFWRKVCISEAGTEKAPPSWRTRSSRIWTCSSRESGRRPPQGKNMRHAFLILAMACGHRHPTGSRERSVCPSPLASHTRSSCSHPHRALVIGSREGRDLLQSLQGSSRRGGSTPGDHRALRLGSKPAHHRSTCRCGRVNRRR